MPWLVGDPKHAVESPLPSRAPSSALLTNARENPRSRTALACHTTLWRAGSRTSSSFAR